MDVLLKLYALYVYLHGLLLQVDQFIHGKHPSLVLQFQPTLIIVYTVVLAISISYMHFHVRTLIAFMMIDIGLLDEKCCRSTRVPDVDKFKLCAYRGQLLTLHALSGSIWFLRGAAGAQIEPHLVNVSVTGGGNYFMYIPYTPQFD
jgi:hypothetical protein